MVYCHYKVCHIIWSSASIQMASCWSNKKWSELFEEKRKYLWKIPEKKMFKKKIETIKLTEKITQIINELVQTK